jgi:hypothetical protein
MGGRPDEGLDGLTRHRALTSDFASAGVANEDYMDPAISNHVIL